MVCVCLLCAQRTCSWTATFVLRFTRFFSIHAEYRKAHMLHSFVAVSTRRHPNRDQNENQLSKCNAKQSKAKQNVYLVLVVSFSLLNMWHLAHFSRILGDGFNVRGAEWQQWNQNRVPKVSQAVYVDVQSVLWLSMSAFDQCLLNSRISLLQNSSSNFVSSCFIICLSFSLHSLRNLLLWFIIRHFFGVFSFLFLSISEFLCFRRNKMRQTFEQMYFCHRYQLNRNLKWNTEHKIRK